MSDFWPLKSKIIGFWYKSTELVANSTRIMFLCGWKYHKDLNFFENVKKPVFQIFFENYRFFNLNHPRNTSNWLQGVIKYEEFDHTIRLLIKYRFKIFLGIFVIWSQKSSFFQCFRQNWPYFENCGIFVQFESQNRISRIWLPPVDNLKYFWGN